MRKLIVLMMLIALFTALFSVGTPATPTAAKEKFEYSFTKIEYRVFDSNGRQGMRIHYNLSANDVKDTQIVVRIRFQINQNVPLLCNPDNILAGGVATLDQYCRNVNAGDFSAHVSRSYLSKEANATWTDQSVFIPYDYLAHGGGGAFYFYAVVSDNTHTVKSEPIGFTM